MPKAKSRCAIRVNDRRYRPHMPKPQYNREHYQNHREPERARGRRVQRHRAFNPVSAWTVRMGAFPATARGQSDDWINSSASPRGGMALDLRLFHSACGGCSITSTGLSARGDSVEGRSREGDLLRRVFGWSCSATSASANTISQDVLSSSGVARIPRRERCRAQSTRAHAIWRDRSPNLGKIGRLGGCARRSRCCLPISNAFSS